MVRRSAAATGRGFSEVTWNRAGARKFSPGTPAEESMRKTFIGLSIAAGIGLICCQSAGAFPAEPSAIAPAATGAAAVQQVQYAERRTKHGYVKCYREFIIG